MLIFFPWYKDLKNIFFIIKCSTCTTFYWMRSLDDMQHFWFHGNWWDLLGPVVFISWLLCRGWCFLLQQTCFRRWCGFMWWVLVFVIHREFGIGILRAFKFHRSCWSYFSLSFFSNWMSELDHLGRTKNLRLQLNFCWVSIFSSFKGIL